jgi:NADH:ubiquinone oxidoreductase subunit 6 (subunit J)
VASWVYLYLTSALMLVLFPHRVRLITQALKSSGWRNRLRLFVIGLLAVLASALLAMLARFAFVWVVLIVILTGAVFVLSYLGLIGVSLMVGGSLRRWARWSPSPWLDLVLGSLVLFALGRIPIAGWICVGILSAWGLGAVLATHLGSGEVWSLQDWQTTE